MSTCFFPHPAAVGAGTGSLSISAVAHSGSPDPEKQKAFIPSLQMQQEWAIRNPEGFISKIDYWKGVPPLDITYHRAFCLTVKAGKACPYDKCRFSHDLAEVFARNHPLYKTLNCVSITEEACPLHEKCAWGHTGDLMRLRHASGRIGRIFYFRQTENVDEKPPLRSALKSSSQSPTPSLSSTSSSSSSSVSSTPRVSSTPGQAEKQMSNSTTPYPQLCADQEDILSAELVVRLELDK